jgi:hypothetical protein
VIGAVDFARGLLVPSSWRLSSHAALIAARSRSDPRNGHDSVAHHRRDPGRWFVGKRPSRQGPTVLTMLGAEHQIASRRRSPSRRHRRSCGCRACRDAVPFASHSSGSASASSRSRTTSAGSRRLRGDQRRPFASAGPIRLRSGCIRVAIGGVGAQQPVEEPHVYAVSSPARTSRPRTSSPRERGALGY